MTSTPLPREHLEQAADWWARIQDADAPTDDISEWLEWVEADPRNRDAFERIQELSLRLKATTVVNEQPAARSARPWKLRLAAVLAVLAVGAALVVRVKSPAAPVLTLSTSVAALEQSPLPDGSSVSLGGSTSIEAVYRDSAREIRLNEGEAYFEVRREATKRPFVVNAGSVSVRALGTAFNVRKTSERVAVTVTEGKVKVVVRKQEDSGVEVAVGQQAVYDPIADRIRVSGVDAQRVLAWRERSLEFIDEPLDSVIANVNRYASRPVEVRNIDLHAFTYTGTFNPDALDEWLIAIERSFPVHVEEREGRTVVVPRE